MENINNSSKIDIPKEPVKEMSKEERKKKRDSRGIGWMLDTSAAIYEKNGNRYADREYP